MVLRRGTGGHYVNGVIGRFPRAGISVRDAGTQTRVTEGNLTINNILASEVGALYQAGQQAGVDTVANNIHATTATTASLFASVPTTPTSEAQIDWTPSANTTVRTGGLTAFTGNLATRAGAFVTGTAYLGAADPNGAKWWQGWTYYAQN
jgi:hypothetical protein